MSQNHKIAKALEELVMLVNSALNHAAFSACHADLMMRANSAISFLVNLFLCPKCQGSGETFNPHYLEHELKDALQQCPDCRGTGIKADILGRLEAEEVTENLHLQGSGNGHRQG